MIAIIMLNAIPSLLALRSGFKKNSNAETNNRSIAFVQEVVFFKIRTCLINSNRFEKGRHGSVSLLLTKSPLTSVSQRTVRQIASLRLASAPSLIIMRPTAPIKVV